MLTNVAVRWRVFGCVVKCFRVRGNKISVAKRLIPENYKQILWSYRRTRLRTGTFAGSSGCLDLVRSANEERPHANADAFATRLTIGTAGHSPVGGNAMAFPSFPAMGLELIKRLEPGTAWSPAEVAHRGNARRRRRRHNKQGLCLRP